jgi:hypothetical protein
MTSGSLQRLSSVVLLVGGALGAQAVARNQSCVTTIFAGDRTPLSGVRVALTDSTAGKRPVAVTDAAGRACLGARDSLGLQLDAVGYRPTTFAFGTGAAPLVLLEQLPDSTVQPALGSRQLLAALTQALHRPELTSDSATTSGIAALLDAAQSVSLQSTVTRDSTGVLVVGYVDLVPDGSRYSEVRLRYNRRQSIVFGITTTRCGDTCVREYDFAFTWVVREGGAWQPDFMAVKDSSGTTTRFGLNTVIAESMPGIPRVPSTMTVRGVVRSEKGAVLAGIDVYTADGAVWTVTDARGAYQLAVPLPPGGALITTRRIGWSPAFRILRGPASESVEWSPVLKATTVLAQQFVRAAGVPDALQSPRYDGFLARRARGIGQFFMAEEIWSAVSLGDVLNHARGITARFSFGSNINSISVPSCPKSELASRIGVFVDGVNQTSMPSFGAPEANLRGSNEPESVLARYVSAAIVGMEIFIGRTQLPPEFADPGYCAVISIWTR